MQEERTYIKMSDLVDTTFTVEAVGQYKWKMWDNDNRKMLVSDTWQKGYSKVYQVRTDRGYLDLSSSKLGEMLESVSKDGTASVITRTFSVKSNGKTGIDIRYYINPAKVEQQSGFQHAQETYQNIKARVNPPTNNDVVADIPDGDTIDLSEIPF